jgi:uncharacterized membrane protein
MRVTMRLSFFPIKIRSQSRIWTIPAFYIAAALVLGGILPSIDRYFFESLNYFSPETATTLLSTISGGMISFTGIVFSMVFVMIQFSSNAYSPRLAPFYLQDTVIKHSLGMFTATFLFTLTSLAANRDENGAVPDISVIVAVGAVTISAIMFLALIQRISVLQITSVLYMIARFGRKEILENYPILFGSQPEQPVPDEKFDVHSSSRSIIYYGISASVLEVDIKRLMSLASRSQAIIEVLYAAGDTVPEGAAVMRVFGDNFNQPDWQLLRAVRLGEQRTIDQDPKYALRLIVDIAIRALSPAINDPTTAVMALDRLEDLLRLLITRELVIKYRYDEKGNLRVIYPSPDWEDFLGLAVDEIRFYGAKSIQVSRRLLALLNDLEAISPEQRKSVIRDHIRRVELSIIRAFPDKEDRWEASQMDRQGIGLTRSLDDDD